MRILVLTTTFPRYIGDPIPSFVYELCKNLQDNGQQMIILAPHDYGAKRFDMIDNMKIYRFPYFYPYKYQKLAYGGGIITNIKRSGLAIVQVPFLFFSGLYHALKIIRKEKIDIIHSHWIIPNGLIGAICSKISGKRHILTEHIAGLTALEKLPSKENIAGFIFRNSNKITVVSSFVYQKMTNMDRRGKNIEYGIDIIPMGVNTVTFKNFNKDELKAEYNIKSENVLVFIGRLVEKKGVSYLINAMPEIISKIPSVELLVCGDGNLRREYEKMSKEMNLENFIRFTGYITTKEKVDYLSLSDIVIVPSITAKSGDTEGLPVVLLEGLSAGKPIIASNVGGISDVIKDQYNGFLIEQKNSSQIADKVLELISNKELSKDFKNNALMTAEKYDWDVIAGKFIGLIKDLDD